MLALLLSGTVNSGSSLLNERDLHDELQPCSPHSMPTLGTIIGELDEHVLKITSGVMLLFFLFTMTLLMATADIVHLTHVLILTDL